MFEILSIYPPFDGGDQAEPAAGLVEALADWLATDPAIAAAAAKAWQAEAPASQGALYVTFSVEETVTIYTFKPGCEIDVYTIRFFARAAAAQAASAVAAVVRKGLLGDRRARFTFTEGREVGRHSVGPAAGTLDPDRGPAGLDSWVSHFPVVFQVARG